MPRSAPSRSGRYSVVRAVYVLASRHHKKRDVYSVVCRVQCDWLSLGCLTSFHQTRLVINLLPRGPLAPTTSEWRSSQLHRLDSRPSSPPDHVSETAFGSSARARREHARRPSLTDLRPARVSHTAGPFRKWHGRARSRSPIARPTGPTSQAHIPPSRGFGHPHRPLGAADCAA